MKLKPFYAYAIVAEDGSVAGMRGTLRDAREYARAWSGEVVDISRGFANNGYSQVMFGTLRVRKVKVLPT